MPNKNQILLVNHNPTDPGTQETKWEIFNYFLIGLTVVTGIIAVIQVFIKVRSRIMKSPKIFYGLNKELKCEGYEKRIICECTHNYKLHITGKIETIKEIFPKVKFTHICAGILIACLLHKCKVTKAELILPKQHMSIVTQGTPQTHQIGFNNVPYFKQTENFFWNKGYTSEIIGIEVDTFGNCSNPWISPLGLVKDRMMEIKFNERCTITLPMHVRETHNESQIRICSYDMKNLENFISYALKCYPNGYPQIVFQTPINIFETNIFCTPELHKQLWNFEVPENAKGKRKCSPKFTLLFNDGLKFLIPNLNATWVEEIISSQGVELRYNQMKCKTQRCVIVQEPKRARRKRNTVISPDSISAGTHCASFIFYSYCPHAVDRWEFAKLGNQILSQIKKDKLETLKLVKKSEFDLLNQVMDVSTALSAEIQGQIGTINESLKLIEQEFNNFDKQLENLAGYFASTLQEHIITSNLMHGIHQSHLKALDLRHTYQHYHKFMAAIITCSVKVKPDCTGLEELLGLIDPQLNILRRFKLDFKIKINWYVSEVYINYEKPESWHINVAYIPYAPAIKIQECFESTCTCIFQDETQYEQADEKAMNFTSLVYNSFTPFACPFNPNLKDSYSITINQTCLKLTVKNLEIDKLKSCELPNYTEKLNFELTVRPFLPNEKQENRVFQLPLTRKSNITDYIKFKKAEAITKNSQFWDSEIEKIKNEQNILYRSVMFSTFPLAASVLSIIFSIIAIILVLIICFQSRKGPRGKN